MLNIVTWNQRKSYQAIQELLFTGAQYDVVAAQEVGLQKGNGAPFCPGECPYRMVWQEGSRAAIYLHKRHDLRAWRSDSGKDWASITLPLGEVVITFVSVYVEQAQFGQPWETALHDLAKRRRPEGSIVLMGDMNLHSPIWDVWNRSSRGVEVLLDLEEAWSIQLLTPRGEPTRLGVRQERRSERDSTIDHIWASPHIGARYAGSLEAGSSDHCPQLAEISLKAPQVDDPFCGFNWGLMDEDGVRKATERFKLPSDLSSTKLIEKEWRRLNAYLYRVALEHVQKRKPHRGKWADWWTEDVREKVKVARRAERQWRQRPTPLHLEEMKQAQKRKKDLIHFQKARTWRNAIQVSSFNSKSLWALERWARKRSHAPSDPPRLPNLDGAYGEAKTQEEKAAALAAQFFPSTLSEGFPDETPWRGHESEPEEEFWKVSEEDVQTLLGKTRSWKAPGEDHLPMGFFKGCHPQIRRALALLISASLRKCYFPACFKRGIVRVLRKAGKTTAEMRDPGSWRPITLLCHMGKLLEAFFAHRLAAMA